MDISTIIMFLGFILAAYSVVGNDVIQTLGTFLAANEKRPWWVLFLFAGSILTVTVLYGWAFTKPERVAQDQGFSAINGTSYYVEYTEAKSSLSDGALVYKSVFKKLAEKLAEEGDSVLASIPFSNIQLYTKNGDTFQKAVMAEARVSGAFTLDLRQNGQTTQHTIVTKRVHEVSYNRLEKFDYPEDIQWWFLLPPIILLIITRFGIPVSTTFLILSFFTPKNMSSMLLKSLSGYVLAFLVAILLYLAIAKILEAKFHRVELERNSKETRNWTIVQWLSTAFLWSMWLVQDFANIYVYLPRDLSFGTLLFSLVVILAMLAYIFYTRGGAIQEIVTAKTNTSDIRSAAIINFIYGAVLLFFKEWSNLPMSTTWVFLGLLAGREYALRARLFRKVDWSLHKMVLSDLGKATIGIVVSILLVVAIYWLRGQDVASLF
ncbi:MAG: hypothetical protein AB8F95_13295 [Bacteroidia bacterium]